jgi:cell division protein FtsZ
MLSRFYHKHVRPLLASAPTNDAKIAVVGVGGGGGNAVNNMVEKGLTGVDFIAVNTDSQDLATNKADYHIQVGKEATGGLGAGARPDVGAVAVKENSTEIEHAIAPYDMVFITAGMGGGTGTGGAPEIASIARELDILTLGIVTRPFECEGPRRMEAAEEGIERLRAHADTRLVIPNERLLDLAQNDTSLVDAFWMADEVLYDATRGIVDLITQDGLINLDFADVARTMKDGGIALLGMSTRFQIQQSQAPNVRVKTSNGSRDGTHSPPGDDEGRPEEAAIEAISSPLFEGKSIRGANEALVNVTGGPGLGFREAMSAIEVVQDEAGDDCDVIFGAVIDEDMDRHFRVTVIATGLDEQQPAEPSAPWPHSEDLGPLEQENGHAGDGEETPFFLRNAME